MASEARKLANIANAQHSTGPRTEAGKKRASLTALRHSHGFFTDLRPSGALEHQLVASEIQTEDQSIQTALAAARTLRENTDPEAVPRNQKDPRGERTQRVSHSQTLRSRRLWVRFDE